MGGRGSASGIIDLRKISDDRLMALSEKAHDERWKTAKKYFNKRNPLSAKEKPKVKKQLEKISKWDDDLKAEYRRRHPQTNYSSGLNPDRTAQYRQTTTTYERRRKRRMKDFEEWLR